METPQKTCLYSSRLSDSKAKHKDLKTFVTSYFKKDNYFIESYQGQKIIMGKHVPKNQSCESFCKANSPGRMSRLSFFSKKKKNNPNRLSSFISRQNFGLKSLEPETTRRYISKEDAKYLFESIRKRIEKNKKDGYDEYSDYNFNDKKLDLVTLHVPKKLPKICGFKALKIKTNNDYTNPNKTKIEQQTKSLNTLSRNLSEYERIKNKICNQIHKTNSQLLMSYNKLEDYRIKTEEKLSKSKYTTTGYKNSDFWENHLRDYNILKNRTIETERRKKNIEIIRRPGIRDLVNENYLKFNNLCVKGRNLLKVERNIIDKYKGKHILLLSSIKDGDKFSDRFSGLINLERCARSYKRRSMDRTYRDSFKSIED